MALFAITRSYMILLFPRPH